jgi:hypothetical protein
LILLPGSPFKTVKCPLIPQEGDVRKAGKHYVDSRMALPTGDIGCGVLEVEDRPAT